MVQRGFDALLRGQERGAVKSRMLDHRDDVHEGLAVRRMVGTLEVRFGEVLRRAFERVAESDERVWLPVLRTREKYRQRIDRRGLSADELSESLEVVGWLVLDAIATANHPLGRHGVGHLRRDD